MKSINPATGQILKNFSKLSEKELDAKISLAQNSYTSWAQTSIDKRCQLLSSVANILRQNKENYARTITAEMGKIISEAESEVEKCAWVCDYYSENAHSFLAAKNIETDAHKSYVRFDPLGTILAVMPWNFPFWQVFRFLAPTLTVGNVALLKHASNVQLSAQLIEDILFEAGYPQGVFQNLRIDHDQAEQVIAHPSVKAVSLTGSEKAGRSIASLAGKHLKKSLLELGGSNAFVILENADLEKVIPIAVNARMLNAGQSCIAAKRFIVVKSQYDKFLKEFTSRVNELEMGDPTDTDTDIGPLARKDLAEDLHNQVTDSVAMGAKLITGGSYENCFYEPTVLTQVTYDMPVFREETFGPLAGVIQADDDEHAFRLAEESSFGLGVTFCTEDADQAKSLIAISSEGAVFINELVKSDPRLPFGGTKNSGYGRELSLLGIHEFVNAKTVYIK